MARQGITGDAAEQIILSITSFALYGFPESHAASFALLVYASAYLKAHYPAAFYTALLNNQPMGFYHPATLVKDAQRHGVRFAPIDVQDRRPAELSQRGAEAAGSRSRGSRRRGGSRRGPGARRSPGGRGLAPASIVVPNAGTTISRCSRGTAGGGRFCNVCAHEWSNCARTWAPHPIES